MVEKMQNNGPQEQTADVSQTVGSVVCAQCGTPNLPGSNYCEECGLKLEQAGTNASTALAANVPESVAGPLGQSAQSPQQASPMSQEAPANVGAGAQEENSQAFVSMAEKVLAATESPAKASALVASGLTDIGVQRTYNQDDFVIFQSWAGRAVRSLPQIFMVADGMGGTVGGEIASEIVRCMTLEWAAKVAVESLGIHTVPMGGMSDALVEHVKAMNTAILNRAQADGTDMGTTITGAVVVGDVAHIVNVGDSRTYLVRSGQIERVTKDHSLVERLLDVGAMDSDEDRYVHPQRNLILRSLGDKPSLEVDVFTRRLQSGDILVMCTDGLWEMVRDPQMRDIILGAGSPHEGCAQLVRTANANGGEDNITVILVWVL